MSGFILRVEAVWFDGTILDTNDISTVRGSSLALLFVPYELQSYLQDTYKTQIKFSPLISGASLLILKCLPAPGVATCQPEDIAISARNFLGGRQILVPDAEKDNCLDLADFRFTIVTQPLKNESQSHRAIAMAKAVAGHQQYEMISVRVPDDPKVHHNPSSICELDRISPAKDSDGQKTVSRATMQRRRFGRERKRDFYRMVLKDSDTPVGEDIQMALENGLSFSQSLQDLTDSEPVLRDGDHPYSPSGWNSLDLTPNLQNKIAVIHMDGNKFTKILAGIHSGERIANFSREIRRLQANMLAELLAWCLNKGKTAAENDMLAPESYSEEFGKNLPDRVRLETLLWGGDEMVFALPAWRGWEAVGVLERALRKFVLKESGYVGAETRDIGLTHGIGLAFANVKTPIRILRSLAGNLADDAKFPRESLFGTKFGFQVGVVESFDVPEGDISALRKAYFGVDEIAHLCFPGTPVNINSNGNNESGDFVKLTRLLKALQETPGLHQAQALLELARKQGLSAINSGKDEDKDKHNNWADALKSKIRQLKTGTNMDVGKLVNNLQSTLTGSGGDRPLINLAWVAYLDGYILPKEPIEPEKWDASANSDGAEAPAP